MARLLRINCFYVDKASFIKEWWDSKDEITSNRKMRMERASLFGRYDIMLEPRIISSNGSITGNAISYDGIIIEFKVQDDDEKDLSDTVQEALRQIEEKDYQANLVAKGVQEGKIRKYGFAFCGKKVMIDSQL